MRVGKETSEKWRTMRAMVVLVVVGLAMTLTMTSCNSADRGATAPRTSADITAVIASAKREARQAENRLLRNIPEGAIEKLSHYPTGSLVTCGSGQKQWASSSSLDVTAKTSRDTVLEELESAAKEEGLLVDRDVAVDGAPRLKISRGAGASMLIGPLGLGTNMDISTFSRCFNVPEGFVPDPAY